MGGRKCQSHSCVCVCVVVYRSAPVRVLQPALAVAMPRGFCVPGSQPYNDDRMQKVYVVRPTEEHRQTALLKWLPASQSQWVLVDIPTSSDRVSGPSHWLFGHGECETVTSYPHDCCNLLLYISIHQRERWWKGEPDTVAEGQAQAR